MSSLLTFILFFVTLALVAGVGLALFYLRKQQKKRVDGLYYQSQRGPIFYKIHGHKGPYVLLIHGLGASTYCWRHIVPELSHKYRVISFDLWGFGHSSKEQHQKMSLDTQIEVIHELLDHFNVQKYHVIGHSMGGEIALWLKHTDERVQKCVAVTPAAHPDLVSDWLQNFHWVANWTPLVLSASSIRRLLIRSLEDPSFVTEEMVESYYEPYREAQAHLSFAAALNIIKDPRVYNTLPVIDADLVVWAAHDSVISRRIVKKMAEKFQAKRTVTHPWSGHLPMEDDHLWLAKQILLELES